MNQDGKRVEEQARRIFGERAASYVTSKAHDDAQVLGRMVELANPQPHWHVLDVATGTGHTALAFAPHVAYVVGIDLTPQMLVHAEKLAAQRQVVNVRYQLADVHELPFDDENFDDETFDLVTCRRAAHHFSDVRGALSEMARVLKHGGLMLVDDRCVPEDDRVDSLMNRLDWLHDESHVREYRPSEWQTLFAEAGCQVLTLETYTRHRPLSSLTDHVSARNVAQIHDLLESLDDDARARLYLEEKEGQLYINHWYVTALARKP